MRRLIVFVLALFLSPAWATTVVPNGSVGIAQDATRVIVQDGSGGFTYIGRTFTNPSARGGALALAETYSGTVAGNAVSLVAKRAIPAAMAISVAKQSFMIGCQAGTELSGYLGLGVPGHGSRVGCNVTDWLFDQGQDPIQTTGSAWGNSTVGFIYPDWKTACDAAILSSFNANGQLNIYTLQTPYSYTMGSSTHYYCSAQVVSGTTLKGAVNTDVNLKTGVTLSKCPASIDALDPAYNIPEGSAPGPDGKCPTGRYNPISASDAAARMDQYADYTKTAAVAEKVLQLGGNLTGASDRTMTGPASVTGTPVTSTTRNPDGSTTTTTTTPTTNYTYSGPAISWTVTNTTTTQTCTGQGSCSTTTTTTDNQQKSECELNPAAAGCGGDPASAGSLYTKKDRTFQSVLTAGRDAILATPLGSAMGNFFTIASGGSCPVWSWSIPYIKATVTVDEFCSDWAMSAYAVMKTAVLIIFAWVAFRWAVL